MESVQNSYRHSGRDETLKRLPLRESRDFNNRRMTKNNSEDPISSQSDSTSFDLPLQRQNLYDNHPKQKDKITRIKNKEDEISSITEFTLKILKKRLKEAKENYEEVSDEQLKLKVDQEYEIKQLENELNENDQYIRDLQEKNEHNIDEFSQKHQRELDIEEHYDKILNSPQMDESMTSDNEVWDQEMIVTSHINILKQRLEGFGVTALQISKSDDTNKSLSNTKELTSYLNDCRSNLNRNNSNAMILRNEKIEHEKRK